MGTLKYIVRLLLTGAVILVVIFAMQYWQAKQSALVPLKAGTQVTQMQPLAPFTLITATGQRFTQDHLKGRWSMFFFGYVGCPQLCPRMLQVMRAVQEQLPSGAVDFYFVTADPMRDTPEKIAAHLRNFSTTFVGLTGEVGQVQQVAQALGIYIAEDPKLGTGHWVHSGSLLLINPQGAQAAVFSSQSLSEDIVHDLGLLLKL